MNESIFSAVYAERRASVPHGIPLIVVLSGASDAGSAVAQLEQYFWEHCSPDEIVRFDTDQFLDYRGRRPMITFDGDRFVDYSPEELTLSLATDELGAPFLLLSGFEPDYRWEAFVDAVLLLVHEFEVSITTWVHAFPMPVPHTRPVTYTVSGTRDDLLERSVWQPTTRLSASVTHLLEYRLHSLGEEVVGFAHLVPHYLASNEYPEVLGAELEGIMAATGLLFATDEIKERSREFRAQVDRQVAESEESLEMIENLERRFDAYMAERGESGAGLLSEEDMPSAEQLASELEQFLADRQQGPELGDGSSMQ